jgi:hypothetical protein
LVFGATGSLGDYRYKHQESKQKHGGAKRQIAEFLALNGHFDRKTNVPSSMRHPPKAFCIRSKTVDSQRESRLCVAGLAKGAEGGAT